MTIYRKVVDGKIILEMVNDGKDIMIDCIDGKVKPSPKPAVEGKNHNVKKSKTYGLRNHSRLVSRAQSKNRVLKHTNCFPDLNK